MTSVEIRLWVGLVIGIAFAAKPIVASENLIRLNTLGYKPTQLKRASIPSSCTNFSVVRVTDDNEVFTGTTSGPAHNEDTGEELWTADFTALQSLGQYRLRIAGLGESPVFAIGEGVYAPAFRLVTRAMYLWRCGTAVSGEHMGQTFAHAACHTNDGWLDYVTGAHERKPALGGWHDAGDYNKYVVNAGVTVGCMLRAWEDYAPAIQRVQLELPGRTGKLPEFLAEIRWETDWLLTMQFPDGSVAHKLSTLKFGGFILPESETQDRYFSGWSSAATADFVAMLAQATRAFRPFDPDYAELCLSAARKSYAFLGGVKTNHNADLRAFSTGAYGTRDADDRLWAAAELWETAGDGVALRDLEARLKSSEAGVRDDFDWGEVGNLGVLTYVKSKREGRDEALLQQCRANLLAAADRVVQAAAGHGYARPLGRRYYWGCNGSVARQALLLSAATRLSAKPVYREAIFDALNHLFGRNYHARSYVTGLGYLPPGFPHDRRSGGNMVEAPWPGYLVGGPHPKPSNWQDKQEDFRTNEIAINWNGALIYALAAVLDDRAQ